MGFLGGATSSGMLQNYKQNKNLGNRKKPLKERIKGYESINSGKKIHDKKMSPEEYIVFKARLAKQKKADQIRIGILVGILIAFAIFAFIWLRSVLEL